MLTTVAVGVPRPERVEERSRSGREAPDRHGHDDLRHRDGASLDLHPAPSMPTVKSADATRIAYTRTGSGPPLVLVHGISVRELSASLT